MTIDDTNNIEVEKYILYINLGNMNVKDAEEYSMEIKSELKKIGLDISNIAIVPIYTGQTKLERIF